MWRTYRNVNSAVLLMIAGVWLLACPQCSVPPETEGETGDVAIQVVRGSDTQPAAQSAPKDCRLLVVAERDEDLLAMVAPAAAKLAKGGSMVLLTVISEETRDEARRLMEQVGMKKALLLRRASNPMKGVGIDIRTGATTKAVHHDRTIELHPDTGKPIGGLVIPYWSDAVLTAIRLSEALELGYVGVDIVLAADGPMVLEANARPGLAIQIANGRGHLDLLEPDQYAQQKRIALHASVAGGR